MPRFKHLAAISMLGTLAIALAAGCIQLPTSPVNAQPESTASARTAQPDGLVGPVVSVADALVKLVSKALTIVGNIGGSLSNGRWRLDVPAGAFDGSATVSIGVATTTSSSCQLEISPADKNNFSTPVRLTVDCSSVSSDQLKDYVILWFNPTTKTWVPVEGSTVDLTLKTVSAPLHHFSGYAVGPKGTKAGW